MTLRENIRRALRAECSTDLLRVHRWLMAQVAWPVKRPSFARMMKMVMLFSEGRSYNCSDFAGMFHISTKTAHRDITFLRDQLALPIRWNAAKHVYEKESSR